jgi:hypothetical protein
VLADEPEETGYVDYSFQSLSTKFLFSPSFLACFVDVSEKLLDILFGFLKCGGYSVLSPFDVSFGV